MWAEQEVTHTELSALVCSLFEGSATDTSLLLAVAAKDPNLLSNQKQMFSRRFTHTQH